MCTYAYTHGYACTHTQAQRVSEREREKETMSRTCKFLSVCEAAAVVEVM